MSFVHVSSLLLKTPKTSLFFLTPIYILYIFEHLFLPHILFLAKNFGNALHKVTGPAYGANVARNFLMCGSAFVATPYFFAKLPEDSKTSTNLFWFGLMGNWTANLAGKYYLSEGASKRSL